MTVIQITGSEYLWLFCRSVGGMRSIRSGAVLAVYSWCSAVCVCVCGDRCRYRTWGATWSASDEARRRPAVPVVSRGSGVCARNTSRTATSARIAPSRHRRCRRPRWPTAPPPSRRRPPRASGACPSSTARDRGRGPSLSPSRSSAARCSRTRTRCRSPSSKKFSFVIRQSNNKRINNARLTAIFRDNLRHRCKKTFFYVFYAGHVFYVFLTFFILPTFFIFKNVHWKYHLKSLSKQRKQIGSVWLFFFVPMLEFPYRPI